MSRESFHLDFWKMLPISCIKAYVHLFKQDGCIIHHAAWTGCCIRRSRERSKNSTTIKPWSRTDAWNSHSQSSSSCISEPLLLVKRLNISENMLKQGKGWPFLKYWVLCMCYTIFFCSQIFVCRPGVWPTLSSWTGSRERGTPSWNLQKWWNIPVCSCNAWEQHRGPYWKFSHRAEKSGIRQVCQNWSYFSISYLQKKKTPKNI